MAPVSFYPAVDNPEYFHVASTDPNQNLHDPNSKLIESGGKAVSGGTPANGDVSRKQDSPHKTSEIGPASLSFTEKPFTDSDSDCPPEVPPRSEQQLNLYVNTPSLSSDLTKSFLGEYICTKSETSPRSSISLENNRLSTGSTTVVSADGATSVHNVLYCSDLSQRTDKSTAPLHHEETVDCATSPRLMNSSPGSNVVSNNGYNLVPLAVSEPVGPSTPPAYSNATPKSATPPAYSNGLMANSYYNVPPKVTSVVAKPTDLPLPDTQAPPVPTGCDVMLQHSLKKRKKVTADRQREEEDAIMERLRLDEILAMCAEYDKQVLDSPKSAQSPTGSSSYHTLPQNRIKTNGSLPREKRSPSYSGSPITMGLSPTGSCLSPVSQLSRGATPEDEIGSIFSYDGSHTSMNSSNARSNALSNYPPFPLVNSPRGTSPPSIHAISPYENVASQHYSMPRSPRTKIRTIAGKERKDCEIFENKMATGEFNAFDKISQTCDTSPATRTSSLRRDCDSPTKSLRHDREAPPAKQARSPKMQRHLLNEPFARTADSPVRSVITNKYFSDDNSIRSGASCYDTPKHSHGGNNFHTIHYSNPSSFPVRFPRHSPIELKIKNKVFEEHMIRNIKDSLNVQNVPEEIKRLIREQATAMELTADLKRKIDELERQENEFLRDLDIERALLEAELATTREHLAEDEQKLASLRAQSDGMDGRHEKERSADQDFIESCKHKLEKTEESLETLEWKNETFEGTTDEETEMLELLKSQHESVEAERKLFEDTEFGQMESEAQRESEREELNKEINDLLDRISIHRDKVVELEGQMTAITASVCKETESLENQRQLLIAKISKERMQLAAIGRQFSNLERLGVTSTNGQMSPSSSSSDESCAPELAEKLAKLHLLDRSQEDLDLINQVTTSSPLGYSDVSLGRKTSATLQEIEKNRHILLAKQGSLVIDSERKRVEELKQRVAGEVKAQWDERKAREQREINCTSLNSVGSEESSPPSSDVPTESLSSDDVQRGNCDRNLNGAAVLLRKRDKDMPSDDNMRPISDASSFCDAEGNTVRLRRDKSRTQRPLTRYLPVRAEVPFDLRQHIETAGHQLDQCPHVIISTSACRGHLCKLSSKFKAWQKRWFVFDRSKRAILYYGDKTEAKPKGGVSFQDIEEVYVDHQHSKTSHNLTFCVKTHQRLFHLMARSPEAMRIWIDVIFTGAEGYREFQSGS